MSASPESFRRMRRNAACPSRGGVPASSPIATPRSGSARSGDHHVLAGAGRQGGAHLLDRLAVVLVGVDVRLVEQDALLEPLRIRPSAIFSWTCSGLPSPAACSRKTRSSASRASSGHVVLGHVERRGGGHVRGDLARELHEVLVAGHEVGLAVDLDQRADLAVVVHVAGDEPLAGGPLAALGGLGLALDPQQLDGLLHVAVGLLERGLAVHHPGARALAQLLHVLRRDLGAHDGLSSSGIEGALLGAGGGLRGRLLLWCRRVSPASSASLRACSSASRRAASSASLRAAPPRPGAPAPRPRGGRPPPRRGSAGAARPPRRRSPRRSACRSGSHRRCRGSGRSPGPGRSWCRPGR